MTQAQVWWIAVGLGLTAIGTGLAACGILWEVRHGQVKLRTSKVVLAARRMFSEKILRRRRRTHHGHIDVTVEGATAIAFGTATVGVIRANETVEERLDRLEAALDEHRRDVDARVTATHERIDEHQRISDQEFDRLRTAAEAERLRDAELDALRLDVALWSLVFISAGGICQAIAAFAG